MNGQDAERIEKLARLKSEYVEAMKRRDQFREAMLMAGSTALRLQAEIAHLEGWPRAQAAP